MTNMEDPKHCRRYQVKCVIEINEKDLPPSDTAALTEVIAAIENLFLKSLDPEIEELFDFEIKELVDGPSTESNGPEHCVTKGRVFFGSNPEGPPRSAIPEGSLVETDRSTTVGEIDTNRTKR